MKIYMDVCCLNRPFDDQTQDRIRVEADSIIAILERCRSGTWELAGSDMIEMELDQCKNPKKRGDMLDLYSLAQSRLSVTAEVKDLARTFQRGGLKFLDSLHLALAEIYRQDVLLTTDDSFLSTARKLKTKTQAANPVLWFMEATLYGY